MSRASQIFLVAALVLGLAALALGLVGDTRASWKEHGLANPPGAIVTALAVRPDEPDTRLVSATVGLFLTNDSGQTWRRTDLPSLWCSPASQLLFDASDADTAYALGTFGLGISRDGGDTWDVAAPPPGADAYLALVQHPADGALYILAHNGLLRSEDRGATWRGLPLPPDAPRLRALAPHPMLPGVVIAGTERGFLLSTDAGATWTTPAGTPSQAVDWLSLLIDTDGRLLAIASTGSYQSVDDGVSWDVAGDDLSGETSALQTGLSSSGKSDYVSWLARAPEEDALSALLHGQLTSVSRAGAGHQVGLAATEEALYATVDAGLTWTLWDTALPAAPVELLASSPADPSRVYAATPFGISVSLDAARSWQSPVLVVQDMAFEAAAIAVDPGQTQSVYVLSQTGTVHQSIDGGRTWEHHSEIDASKRTGTLSLAVVTLVDGNSVPCLLSDRLYCASATGGAIDWVPALVDGSRSRPIALLSSREVAAMLITPDGTMYRPNSTVPTAWMRVGSSANLDGDVSAVWRPPDGEPLYAVTVYGTLYASSGDGWRLLREGPESIEGSHQTALAGASGSDRPVVLAAVERGVALWAPRGRVALLERSCPASGTYARLTADLSPNGGVYRISGDGVLSRFDVDIVAGGRLAPWFAGLSALCALAGLVPAWRARRRATHNPQNAAGHIDATASAQMLADAPPPDCIPTSTGPVTASDRADRPAQIAPPELGRSPLAGTPEDAPGPASESSALPDGTTPDGDELVRQMCERLGFRILAEQSRGSLVGYMLDASTLRLSLPESLPLVVAPCARIDPPLAAEIRALTAAMGAVSPFTLAIQLGRDSDSPDPGETRRMSGLHSADGLIALSAQDVAQILDADEPRTALARLVQRTVPLGQISPFVQSGPVPRTMFYGRDYEIKALLRTLYDRSVAVVGARKIGKTSFLGLVHQELLQSPELLPVYVDCHHVTDEGGFLRALSLMGGVPVESASLDVLRRVVMRLRGRQGSAGQTVVLELDEVDNLLRYDLVNELRILQTFRSLSDEGLCRFVLCGERVLDTVAHDAALPLKAFCSTLRLGYLAQDEAQRLVREPLADLGIALQDPDGLSAEIVSLSGRHPNILQAVCQLLVERVAGRPERIILYEDLEAVSQSEAFRDLFFEVNWGNATTLERLISVMMAQKAQFGLDQVRLALEAHGIRIAEQELISALDGLVLTSLISPRGTGFAFTSDVFRQVLQETGFAQGFRDSLAETLLDEQTRI